MHLLNPIINIITLGCPKNTVDSEILIHQLKTNNFQVIYDSENYADIIIINTCGFIEPAKQESIDTILYYVSAKKTGLLKKIYVIGCLSQRYKNELIKEIPEVDGFFGVNEISILLEILKTTYPSKSRLKERTSLLEEKSNNRSLITPRHYAYLKIAEGCNRKCSFCVIPFIRGRHISRPIGEIIEEAEFLSRQGVKELILVSQDLTYYGMDKYKKRCLAMLLKELEKISGIKWLRLHYLYPADFRELTEVLSVMKNSKKICKYIDIPFQHITDKILKSMKRGISKKETLNLIKTIREEIPQVAIRTTLIIGYPGETLKEFDELKEFVIETRFDRLGVLMYSPEEGTSAFKLGNQIPLKIKQKRANEIMEIQQKISYELNQQKIGKRLKVLIDREKQNYFIGRTEYDSPEIDNEVWIKKEQNLKVGNFATVTITGAGEFDLYGSVNIQ